MMTAEQAKFLAELSLRSIENEYQITKRVLAAVPADRLEFKLGEKGKTARELMWHIASSEAWFADGVASGAFAPAESAPPAPDTAADILAWYGKTVPPILARIKALSGEQLLRPANFHNIFNFPAVQYISIWQSHTVHHRGQLSTYLRAMNARVPSIYGGSADEPFEMPASGTARSV